MPLPLPLPLHLLVCVCCSAFAFFSFSVRYSVTLLLSPTRHIFRQATKAKGAAVAAELGEAIGRNQQICEELDAVKAAQETAVQDHQTLIANKDQQVNSIYATMISLKEEVKNAAATLLPSAAALLPCYCCCPTAALLPLTHCCLAHFALLADHVELIGRLRITGGS